MPSLSDRLKSLGVQVGTRNLPKPDRDAIHPIEQVMEGRLQETPFGEAFVVEARYPSDHLQGEIPLIPAKSLRTMAAWSKEPSIVDVKPEAIAFLDTETTGLAGGVGTLAFMVGVGRFEEDEFLLAQYFLRDPIEEPALLAALENFLSPCQALVTFNGKSFDVPLLEARYIYNRADSPLPTLAHVDALHLARRLWRDRLPSRTLLALEIDILGLAREEEDVPGWMIPQMYFDYLRGGDARPMKSIFYHNAEDILSMAALFAHMAAMLDDPFEAGIEHGVDLISIGRLYQDLGEMDRAVQIMELGLSQELPDDSRRKAVERLAVIHRRRGDLPAAVALWEQAAEGGEVYALEMLAKHYEHRLKEFEQAIQLTQQALEIVRAPNFPRFERRMRRDELEHRLARLERKLARRDSS